jgi:1,4-alpha-glucan branching enzyme
MQRQIALVANKPGTLTRCRAWCRKTGCGGRLQSRTFPEGQALEYVKGQLVVSRRSKKPKTQTFRYIAPAATSVMLVGDFTEWQQQALVMEKGPDGVWTTSLKLPPGKHSYLFIVDGQWCDDPECTVRVPNPFGGHDMIREVG